MSHTADAGSYAAAEDNRRHASAATPYAATVRRAGSATPPPPSRRQQPAAVIYRGPESQLDIALRDVRAVAEAQSRLLHVVEGISEELARVAARVDAAQHFAASPDPGGRQQTELFSNVDRLNKVVHELQRVVQTQRADSTPSSGLAMQLVRHEAALAELQRCRAEDVARLEAALAERRHSQQQAGALGDGGLVARLARQEAEIGDLRRLQAEAQSAHQRQQQQASQIAQHEAAMKALQQLPEELQRLQEQSGRDSAGFAAKLARLEEEIAEVSSRQQGAAAEAEAAAGGLLGLRPQVQRLEAECGEVRRRLQDLAAVRDDGEAAGRLGRCEAAAAQAQSRSARLGEELRQQQQACADLEEKVAACSARLDRGGSSGAASAAAAAQAEALAARVEALESASRAQPEKPEAMQKQLMSELRLELRGAVQGQQNALTKRLEGWEARLQEELAQRLQRQVAELRLEVRGGVQGQEAKLRSLEQQFSQLDEQVWQADKRIRARVEEISCGSFTAAVARASEALGGGGGGGGGGAASAVAGRLSAVAAAAEQQQQQQLQPPATPRGEVGAAKGAATSRMPPAACERLPSSPAWGSVEDEEDEALSARPASELPSSFQELERADDEEGAGTSLGLRTSGEEPPSLRGSFGRPSQQADEAEDGRGEEKPGGGGGHWPPTATAAGAGALGGAAAGLLMGSPPPPSLQEVLWAASPPAAPVVPSGSPQLLPSPPPTTAGIRSIGSAETLQSQDHQHQHQLLLHHGLSPWGGPPAKPAPLPSGLSGSFLTAATSAANAFAEATMEGFAGKIGSAKRDVPVSSTSSTGSSAEWVEAAHQEQ